MYQRLGHRSYLRATSIIRKLPSTYLAVAYLAKPGNQKQAGESLFNEALTHHIISTPQLQKVNSRGQIGDTQRC